MSATYTSTNWSVLACGTRVSAIKSESHYRLLRNTKFPTSLLLHTNLPPEQQLTDGFLHHVSQVTHTTIVTSCRNAILLTDTKFTGYENYLLDSSPILTHFSLLQFLKGRLSIISIPSSKLLSANLAVLSTVHFLIYTLLFQQMHQLVNTSQSMKSS